MKKKLEILSVVSLLLISLITPAYADAATGTVASSVFMHPGEAQIVTFSGSSAPQWSSADTSIATVDATGRVTGVSAGHTTVTATFGPGCTAQCAVNVGYKGIDVSEHNGSDLTSPINWAAVKSSGIDFAMIRTGYGGDLDSWSEQTDADFETNYSGATAAGLKVGVYHYSYAMDATMASQEADFCLSLLNGRHLDYPVVYDVENTKEGAYNQATLSADTLGQIVQTFCSKLQAAGYKTAVYSYVSFYNAHLTSPLVAQYDTWIANTGGIASPIFSYPYTMWQYAQDYVSGVSGACDVDYSYVDYSSGGGSSGTQTPPMDPMTFLCDTSSYTFGSNRTYTYKITTPDTYPPTAVSSNPSAVTVSSARTTANGFLFTLTNIGAGQATITTTAGDGRSVSFVATGTGSAGAGTLKCDTSSYTFGSASGVYSYKITTGASTAPKAVSSNPSAVSVAYSKKLSDGYLYQIKNVGAGTAVITTTASDGTSVSFPATGTAQPAVQTGVKSDTPFYFTMKQGSTYQFEFTGGSGIPLTFSIGNGSVLRGVSTKKINGKYYYKVTAVGKGCAGLYAGYSGKAERVSIVTVA